MKWEILGKNSTSIIKTLLKNRKIKDQNEFFNPTLPQKLTLKELGINKLEMDKAISRIKRALENKEKVIIYGDYDADGICGTAILWETLYSLGLDVLPYLPERFSEGYGLNAESVEKLKAENEKLKVIITVDNGIVAHGGIKKAEELGIDVIVTDHHQKSDKKLAVDCILHTTKVSGSAIAWILSRELGGQSGLDLVAIGTIADQLPLVGPNRSFAKYGLEELNKTKRSGLLALFAEAKVEKIGVYEVGFMIAPRINSMGRLLHAIDSLRLLCVKSKTKAQQLARHLNETNIKRQKIVDEVVLHALQQVYTERSRSIQNKPEKGVIIVAHEEYHEGVIGLAAAKLVEEFYRPAIVLAIRGNIAKASARSIFGFNIIAAIRQLPEMYLEGGGHPMAAGFSIETIKIQEFVEKINKIAKPLLTKDVLSRRLAIDLKLHFNQINYELYDKLTEFEPTGLGNPAPTFVTKGVEMKETRIVGRDGSHLKLKLQEGSVILEAIAFGFGNLMPSLTPKSKTDVVYTIEDNSWNGRKSLQLKIKDIKIRK